MICLKCKYFNAAQRYCRNIKAKYVGCDECYKANPKPTNADRIRSMSDEELAEYLDGVCHDLWQMFVADPQKMWLEWLKQESEGE